MPKFDALVTRIFELSTTITVRATNEEQAEEKALHQLEDSTLRWEIQDKHAWAEESDEYRIEQIDEA
jgi:hypothetical protein